MHVGAVLGVLVWVAGFVTLAGTFGHDLARVLGRMGAASMLAGAAVFGLEHSTDGIAGHDLAAWAAAESVARADLELTAQTAFAMLRGPSLIGIAALWGVPLVAFGLAVLRDDYPAWLGRAGVAVGAVTILGAIALVPRKDLFPGMLLYGVAVSVLAQLWIIATGVLMWRRGRSASRSTATTRHPVGDHAG